jgi:two-component system, chemotaxis family, sensor kinase Cph1
VSAGPPSASPPSAGHPSASPPSAGPEGAPSPASDAPGAAVDLSNCDREPIHTPSAIQPHGALLVFDAEARLVARSANAEAILGPLPVPGGRLGATQGTASLREHVAAGVAAPDTFFEPFEVALGGGTFDAISHHSGGWLVVELERRPEHAPPPDQFAVKAHRALTLIQRQPTSEALLATAVREVRALTGFDRVMAYRFRDDDSGDVVAEDKRPDLEPFLGQRYPAGDIPAQARRLYVLNPLRLIADVGYAPVALEPRLLPQGPPPQAGVPLDLSQSVLRSVSPIHVEYLTNMGVAASMSISIVVSGRLWGLIACHHYSGPRLAPYAVRAACQLLSQVLSALVERTEAKARAEFVARTAEVRLRLLERARASDDLLQALATPSPGLRDLVTSSGTAVTLERRVHREGLAPPRDAVAALAAHLTRSRAPDVYYTQQAGRDLPPEIDLGDVCGVLALRFHREHEGYLFWFRPEEVEEVRWGGNPEKAYVVGPLGPRLTPRGSFAEWRETVRGRSAPFDAAEIELAARLRVELQDAALAKAAEFERTRDLFVAALGHDLRNPLSAITMAGELLSQGDAPDALSERVGARIASSAGRMRRLVDQMLDLSRVQQGLGLGLVRKPTDVSAVVADVAQEMRAAFPGVELEVDARPHAVADVDADRLAQLVTNLLSNARHHGDVTRPVWVRVRAEPSNVIVEVTNHGPTIPEAERPHLFRAFKRESVGNRANQRGLGLGLFITNEIAVGHGGRVDVESADGLTTFRVTLPR